MAYPETYLGVDLGGTKLLVGEITAKGEILRSRRYPTGYLTQEAAMELIQNSIADYLENEHPKDAPKPLAMGVGLLGRVDGKNGIWLEIDGQRSTVIPAAKILSERFQMPCFLDNDVRSATKAERRFGAGQGSENMIYINVGTGIAAGIVTGGQLVRGGNFNSGEVGHSASGIADRTPCVCGRPDCVETIASGSGLDKSARLLRSQYPDTALPFPEDGRVFAGDIFALYGKDPLCTRLVDNAAQGIANLIMNLVRVTDPDTVVLGGGVMKSGFLYPKVLERLNKHTIRYVTNGVVLTRLDPAFIGILGAGTNAMEGLNQTKS